MHNWYINSKSYSFVSSWKVVVLSFRKYISFLSLRNFSLIIYLANLVAKRIRLKQNRQTTILKASFDYSTTLLQPLDFLEPSSSTAKRPRYAIPSKWNADVPTFEQPKSSSNFSSGVLIRQPRQGLLGYFKSISSCLRSTLLARSQTDYTRSRLRFRINPLRYVVRSFNNWLMLKKSWNCFLRMFIKV